MPKHQPTAAKAARAAAREGAKYTAALRQEHAESQRRHRRGHSRRPRGPWWMGTYPLLKAVNDSTMRALVNNPALKAVFPYGGTAARSRDDSSPG